MNLSVNKGGGAGGLVIYNLLTSLDRQVNQHIEFEADWETGFNLYMKLSPVISLVLRLAIYMGINSVADPFHFVGSGSVL